MSIQPLAPPPPSTYSPAARSSPPLEKAAVSTDVKLQQSPSVDKDTKTSAATSQKEAVQEATQKANQAVQGLRSDLKFTIDEETGWNVVKFIDVKTKEVIRQIPAQEMLVIAKRLDELRGLLIKETV